jgi:hypothetical protein
MSLQIAFISTAWLPRTAQIGTRTGPAAPQDITIQRDDLPFALEGLSGDLFRLGGFQSPNKF